MVAKITILKRLLDAVNYNEKKVEKGKAECIHAGNYIGDAASMTFFQKLSPLKMRDELNTRATTKTLHVSLNFDPSENLSEEKLRNIADTYLEKIGFGNQPYLVYKHHDAGHPHIHIVSTAINADGSRINTHNIGRLQSEKARKEIEESFHLVKASSKHTKPDQINTIPEAITYGKGETKSSISRVVTAVLHQYTFTSLPEFNAALRQFNIVADRGDEKSRVFKNRGLMFRLLDSTGSKIGVPIKASSISSKPTLTNLEKLFDLSKPKKELSKNKVKMAIDLALQKRPRQLNQLIAELKTHNIYTLVRQNSDGRIYGITLVDNRTKSVFNGSDLGKQYSITRLQDQLKQNMDIRTWDTNSGKEVHIKKEGESQNQNHSTLIIELIQPQQDLQNTPYELRKKKKRKKNND